MILYPLQTRENKPFLHFGEQDRLYQLLESCHMSGAEKELLRIVFSGSLWPENTFLLFSFVHSPEQ